MGNFVYIATSLDGYIARKDGSLDWLVNIDNPEKSDYGFSKFITQIDAVVIGRGTYEVVAGFRPWPYNKPVFVLSTTLKPEYIESINVEIFSKDPSELVSYLNSKGLNNLYIDGGKTIQGFLSQNLIDNLIISKIPVLLGSGIPLFGEIDNDISFTHINTTVFKNGIVKSHYKKK
jgi:dihydrofolate reductase